MSRAGIPAPLLSPVPCPLHLLHESDTHCNIPQAYQEFHNYQELVKSIEKTRKEIENNYLKLQKALETSAKKEKTGDGRFI